MQPLSVDAGFNGAGRATSNQSDTVHEGAVASTQPRESQLCGNSGGRAVGAEEEDSRRRGKERPEREVGGMRRSQSSRTAKTGKMQEKENVEMEFSNTQHTHTHKRTNASDPHVHARTHADTKQHSFRTRGLRGGERRQNEK